MPRGSKGRAATGPALSTSLLEEINQHKPSRPHRSHPYARGGGVGKPAVSRKEVRKQARSEKKQRKASWFSHKDLPAAPKATPAPSKSVAPKSTKKISNDDVSSEVAKSEKLAKRNPALFQLLRDSNLVPDAPSTKVVRAIDQDPEAQKEIMDIARYERLLKLNKKAKPRTAAPKAFVEDGLGELFEEYALSHAQAQHPGSDDDNSNAESSEEDDISGISATTDSELESDQEMLNDSDQDMDADESNGPFAALIENETQEEAAYLKNLGLDDFDAIFGRTGSQCESEEEVSSDDAQAHQVLSLSSDEHQEFSSDMDSSLGVEKESLNESDSSED